MGIQHQIYSGSSPGCLADQIMKQLVVGLLAIQFLALTCGLDVPDSMKIAIEPEDVLEMEMIKRPLSIYIADSKGKLITVLGGGTWNCEVSLLSGPGGILVGTKAVNLVNGSATFPNLYITEAGSGYVLQFEVTYPTTATIPTLITSSFTVGARPLGVKLSDNTDMRAGDMPFTVGGTIWDEALDQAADSEVLAGLSWECDLTMADKGMVVKGNTMYKVSPGNGTIIFEDVRIPKLGKDQALRIDCFSPGYFARPLISGQSDPFIVYDFPKTSLLRKTVAKVQFKGPYNLVEEAIVAYNSFGLHGLATCLDCPPGVLPKPKEMEKTVTPPPLADWDPCTAPIFINPDLSCLREQDYQD